MKLWPLLLLPLLAGCVFSKGDITSITTTCYGGMFGYDPSTHLPSMYVGIIRQTFHKIPSNAPPVTSSLSVEQHWMTANLFEEFSTGNAQIPSNSVAKMRARMLAPKDQRQGSNHGEVFGRQQTAFQPYIQGDVVTISRLQYESLKSAADSTTQPPFPSK